VTQQSSHSLAEAAQQLLTAFALGTAVVCVLAAVALLWQRWAPAAGAPRAAYYVGRRDGSSVAAYFVTHTHVGRLEHPRAGALADRAWGTGAETEALAATMLRHHTGLQQPLQWQLGALRMWLEMQPEDGFVIESVELARIIGSPLPGRLPT